MTMNYGAMHRIDRLGDVKLALANTAGTGSPQNGAAVDRTGYLSGIGAVTYSTSGGVAGGTVLAKLQDSADGSTGWADYGSAVTVTLTGTNPSGLIKLPADLGGAKRYVRVVVDADPTGGTPASNVAATLALFGKDRT